MQEAVLLGVLLVSLFQCTPIEAEYQLTFESAKCIENTGIGRNWSHEVLLDGKKMVQGKQYQLNFNRKKRTHSISVRSTEFDEVYPDEKIRLETLYPQAAGRYARIGAFEYDVSVKEGHGPGAGGHADWAFSFLIE